MLAELVNEVVSAIVGEFDTDPIGGHGLAHDRG